MSRKEELISLQHTASYKLERAVDELLARDSDEPLLDGDIQEVQDALNDVKKYKYEFKSLS